MQDRGDLPLEIDIQEITPSQYDSALEHFFRQIPENNWIDWAHSVSSRWPHILDRRLIWRNSSEVLGFSKLINHKRKSGVWWPKAPTVAEHDALTLALTFYNLAKCLDQNALNTIVSRITDGGRNFGGIEPVRLELDVYQLGIDRGFDVVPIDMKRQVAGSQHSGQIHDFDMQKNGQVLSVECKNYSEDKLNTIKTNFFYELLNLCDPVWRKHILKYGSFVFDVSVEAEKLDPAEIRSALQPDQRIDCTVSNDRFTLQATPLPLTAKDLINQQGKVDENWYNSNSLLPKFQFGRPQQYCTIVSGENIGLIRVGRNRPIDMAKRLMKALKADTKSQVAKDKPSVCVVGLLGMESSEMARILRIESFRNIILEKLFHDRPHITAISFVGRRSDLTPDSLWRPLPARQSFVFQNPYNRYAETGLHKEFLLRRIRTEPLT